jgi:predicted transposase/invertase (TIGR01784 family)
MHEMVEIAPLFQRLFILSKIGNFTAEELKQYEDSMKDMSDYYNIIDTAAEEAEKRGLAKGMEIGRLEGREEGRLEGRKEGEAKAKAELVRKMIDAGMNPEQIGQITGLDISEIQAMA